jgi:hypothetical protein
LAIDNEGKASGGLSHAVLKGDVGGQEIEIGTAPNTVVYSKARCCITR